MLDPCSLGGCERIDRRSGGRPQQAKGIIAERHDIDMASAFGKLRAHARSGNATLHDIARQVIDGGLRL